MFLYLSLFLVFVALYFIAEKGNKKELLWLSMLPPALFEGLRDELIGADMHGYGTIWFYDMSTTYSVWQVILYASTPEYGYHLLIYFCKKISSDIHLYMTACAFIKVAMVYLTAWKLREKINTIAFLLSYYFFFYVTGFSMMRQSIAVAICIFSLTFLLNKDLWKFSLLVVIAYFFHNSAIIMYIWLPILYMRSWKFRYLILVLGGLLVYFFIATLMSFLVGSMLFKDEMAERYMNSGVNTSKTMILIATVFLFYGQFVRYRLKDMFHSSLYLLIISSFYSLVFTFLASYIEVAFRVAYYMLICSTLLTLSFVQIEKTGRRLYTAIFVGLFLFHFYVACSHGLAGALDYSSKILGI